MGTSRCLAAETFGQRTSLSPWETLRTEVVGYIQSPAISAGTALRFARPTLADHCVDHGDEDASHIVGVHVHARETGLLAEETMRIHSPPSVAAVPP